MSDGYGRRRFLRGVLDSLPNQVAVVDDQGALVGALYVSELVNQFLDIQADLRGEEQIRSD